MIILKFAFLLIQARYVILDIQKNCQCGKISPQPRIVGGREAVKNAYPWQAKNCYTRKTLSQSLGIIPREIRAKTVFFIKRSKSLKGGNSDNIIAL